MKTILAKSVRKKFKSDLKIVSPHFKLDISPGAGLDLYSYKAHSNITFYILLQIHSKYNAFIVEAAVSKFNRWPTNLLPSIPNYESFEDEQRFRISRLWSPSNKSTHWWLGDNMLNTPISDSSIKIENIEELLLVIPKVVGECTSKIKDYLLPFFEQILKNR